MSKTQVLTALNLNQTKPAALFKTEPLIKIPNCVLMHLNLVFFFILVNCCIKFPKFLWYKLAPRKRLPSLVILIILVRSNNRLELRHKLEGHQLGVVSVDINRQGTVAASSSLNSQIRLWDIETGKQIKLIDAGPGLFSFMHNISHRL